MFQITSSNGNEDIQWDIEISWKVKKELHRQKAIAVNLQSQSGFELDTDKLINVLFNNNCIKGWSLDEELTEENLWELGMFHIDMLAIEVASILLSGVKPGDDIPLEKK